LIICEMMLPDENALTVSRKLRAMSRTSNVPFMIVAGRVDDRLAGGAATMSRTPCPTHVLVKQADALIALSRSLRVRVLQACGDSERLIAETKRMRDQTRESRRRVV
jgi:DNA-binding response OmpR family regulator